MKQIRFVAVASILATMSMMITTQPACAQQRQKQRPPSWQPERRGQPGHAQLRPGNNSWRRGLWSRMSDDEKDHIYNYIESNFPKIFVELERLRNANPKRFEHRMNRVAVEMQGLMELVENHPRRGALHIQERKLELELRLNIAKYRRSNIFNEKRKLISTMEKLIGQLFDTQTKRQELEVHELENRLAELTRHVKQRQAHRQDFIKKHLDRVRQGKGGQGGPPVHDGPPEKGWLGEPGKP